MEDREEGGGVECIEIVGSVEGDVRYTLASIYEEVMGWI